MFKLVLSIILSFILAQAYSQRCLNLDVIKVKDKENIYQFGDIFISGQPNLSDLEWFQSQGVKTIINLRSKMENEQYNRYAYREQEISESQNITYYSLPIGSISDYTTENLMIFANHLNSTQDTLLIHCKSGGRVTYFLMAYLIKYQDLSKDQAYHFGKQIKYVSYLDKLLGEE